MKIHVARYESRHFDFMGTGRTLAEARAMLADGLRAHATEYEIEDSEWWWRDSIYSSPEDALSDGGSYVLEVGKAYRDREALPRFAGEITPEDEGN